jgi:hypothetical protein
LNIPRGQTGPLRGRVAELLRTEGFATRLSEWTQFPPRQVISPLLSFLYSTDEEVKWRAVTAVGIVVAEMADQDMEAARTIMRRLIWSLNDESGGIGWGAAEAMGEIMARHERLAEEFHRILISYIRDDGNRLEHDLLECGVLWGMGRLAQVRSNLIEDSVRYILPYLQSQNPTQRGLAAWTLGFLEAAVPLEALAHLLQDQNETIIFEQGSRHRYRISDLATRLLRGKTRGRAEAETRGHGEGETRR